LHYRNLEKLKIVDIIDGLNQLIFFYDRPSIIKLFLLVRNLGKKCVAECANKNKVKKLYGINSLFSQTKVMGIENNLNRAKKRVYKKIQNIPNKPRSAISPKKADVVVACPSI